MMKDGEPGKFTGLTKGRNTTIQPVFEMAFELTKEQKDVDTRKIKIEVINEAENQSKVH